MKTGRSGPRDPTYRHPAHDRVLNITYRTMIDTVPECTERIAIKNIRESFKCAWVATMYATDRHTDPVATEQARGMKVSLTSQPIKV